MRQRYYAVFWTVLTVVVVGTLLALAFLVKFGANQRSISPESFKPPPTTGPSERSSSSSTPDIESLPDVEVKGTEIVLSSPDGQMQLRLHSELGSAADGLVELPEAELEFFFQGGKKLYLLAKNIRYEMQEETAVVNGDLSGEILALRERFTAQGLTWDRHSHILTIRQATLADPGFRTQARDITLDVKNDLLEILGGVEVEI